MKAPPVLQGRRAFNVAVKSGDNDLLGVPGF